MAQASAGRVEVERGRNAAVAIGLRLEMRVAHTRAGQDVVEKERRDANC
jgi:hypothetical protein